MFIDKNHSLKALQNVTNKLDKYFETLNERRKFNSDNRHTAFGGDHSIFAKNDCAHYFANTKVDGANIYE